MLSLVKNELIKLFAGKKIYVFMLAIVLANSLIGVESLVGAIDIPVNGQNVPILMLPTIVNILLPLFVIVLVAGMITDEYANGTLKLSLIHPVSRTSLLTAKLLALGVISPLPACFRHVCFIYNGHRVLRLGRSVHLQ